MLDIYGEFTYPESMNKQDIKNFENNNEHDLLSLDNNWSDMEDSFLVVRETCNENKKNVAA